ncbi:LysR family transcriptional regulator [Pseudomonas sp. FW215-R2]|uniref:LysR family transcriptional regulator n=1 Tax=unclassified Pseudomonas TaxID=196821 RepID=UPI000C883162|nr:MULTISPECIES: LysR family transcriptional regulator [unclassified Pseudomonas]PMX03100.1 LysR family transcriptional regulator [Pseudomonas sp. FW215-R2]PMX11935.1 LysR family transcriptional regulator [Pseudomonas sp. FW215-L1]PMX25605.1 LysR family transcriptional regulator [Pseudomonas sp. FW215-E1]PNA32607.1 LysR family transcriptional regulator [Pseudomonas sp. FW215-R4]
MDRSELGDLAAFLVVAQELSFTRAAARLATSQSSLSHTIRRLETRLGVRLLARTTRSMATTEAGERLLETLRPAFEDIDAKLRILGEMRHKPAGIVRITSSKHAAEGILWPAISRLLPEHPDIKVEISTDAALTDIVTDRFDAGVRLGEQVDKDMIAVRIGPDLRLIVVGAPSYLARSPEIETPHDLTRHACINVRLPSSGALYVWEFHNEGRDLNVRVDGPLIFNNMRLAQQAAVEGFGLAFVFEDAAQEQLRSGQLIQVLDEWCPFFAGYHLYYPSRRQQSPAFTLLVEALRMNVAALPSKI